MKFIYECKDRSVFDLLIFAISDIVMGFINLILAFWQYNLDFCIFVIWYDRTFIPFINRLFKRNTL